MGSRTPRAERGKSASRVWAIEPVCAGFKERKISLIEQAGPVKISKKKVEGRGGGGFFGEGWGKGGGINLRKCCLFLRRLQKEIPCS